MSTAYLLITHGSRDPRPQASANRLAQMVRDYINQSVLETSADNKSQARPRQLVGVAESIKPKEIRTVTRQQDSENWSGTRLLVRSRLPVQPMEPIIVGTAVLELGPLSLSQQIFEFARRVRATGINQVVLVPLFLMKGRHVMEDIPQEVAEARQLLGSSMQLRLCPAVGSHKTMPTLLADKLSTMPPKGRLLVSHGSRRQKGNRAIDALARSLGTTVAYWSTPPNLETQVINLMQQGCQTITILPYFLFAGGITDAVTHQTEELAERFPKINFRMLPPLGATHELAQLVIDLVQSQDMDVPDYYPQYA